MVKKYMKRKISAVLVFLSIIFTSCSFVNSYVNSYQLKNISYTITFDANNGSDSIETQKAEQKTTVSLNANTFTYDGYEFAGWATTSDATIAAYADGDSYTMGSSDVTLYAVWGTSYTITFDANGGSGTMEAQTAVTGQKVTLNANTFTYDGYEFAGWATTSDATTVEYEDGSSFSSTEAVTLYALWGSTYTITFDANGGSGTMEDEVVLQDSSTVTLTANTYTYGDYVFTGWATTSDATSIEYEDEGSISVTGDITLYAVWNTTPHITFNANGGSGSMDPEYFTSGVSFTLSACTFTRTDYSFDGWATSADSTDVTYTDEQENVYLSASVTLYAVWVDPVSVTGIEVSSSTVTMSVGDTFQLSAEISPSNAYDQDVTWTSDDTDVVTVSDDGLLTGIAAGTAGITLTSDDGSYVDACSVTVDEFPFTLCTASPSHSGSWYSIAVSEDGSFIIASDQYAEIYTSEDSGTTWTEQTGAPSDTMYNLSVSSNAGLIAAYASDGYIYTSSDKGVSWTEQTKSGSRDWSDIAVSADGTFIAACVDGGYIFTSADSGSSWTAQTSAGSKNWNSIAVSEDGSVILAGPSSGYLYKSSDSGDTWTTASNSSSSWYDVAMSSDGSILYASRNSTTYVSSDSGTTWTYDSHGNQYVSCSEDGKTAVTYSKYNTTPYYTIDTGSSWTTLDRSCSACFAVSGDGATALYADRSSSGGIYAWDMSSSN